MGVIKWKKFSDEQLREILDKNTTFKGALHDLGYNTQSNNNKIIKTIAEYLNYDLSNYLYGKDKNYYIGKIYGELTIIEIDEEKSKEKRRLWVKAQCSCGKVISVSHNALQRGNTKSCGHLNYIRENIIGNKYGRWTVLEYVGNKNKIPHYKCKCECGTIREVSRANLMSGISKSCGCLHKEIASQANFIDLTGQNFGKLKVIELDIERSDPKKHNIWKCLCECGNITYVKTADLRSGNTKSCGCFRQSFGEEQIKEILLKNNINFCQQFYFSDLKGDVNTLKFDFGIFDNNNNLLYLIEYNGIQHYEPVKYFGGEERFERQQRYDLKKKEYCLSHNIPLFIIRYDENITEDKVIKKEKFKC